MPAPDAVRGGDTVQHNKNMNNKNYTIYFDNAATSFPKPPSVRAAVAQAFDRAGGNPGRGAHALALSSARTVFECRERIAAFTRSGLPENVVFTLNATYALNIAIKSLIRPGAQTVTSCFEHNSVRRPLSALGCRVTRFDPRLPEDQFIRDIEMALRRGAEAVVCAHASNVLPIALPVGKIAALCRKYCAVCIIDASQSAGSLDVDVGAIGADAVCFPGHKGLYGPMGCGVCVFGSRYAGDASRLKQVTEGGSGVSSLEAAMPSLLPERFEAGTLCVPAIAGLSAGIEAVERIGLGSLRERERAVARRAREVIGNTRGAILYDPPGAEGPIVLFNLDGKRPEETAALLDERGICVRAGLHCAPDAHRSIGTLPLGAVRLSFGMFNTRDEVERFAKALREIG